MSKITSLKDLEILKEEAIKRMGVRVEGGVKDHKKQLIVCGGTGCKSGGCRKVVDAMEARIKDNNLENDVELIVVGCVGFCEQGPIMKTPCDDAFYVKVSVEDAEEIFDEHIMKGNVVERCLFKDPITRTPIRRQEDMPFYSNQTKLVLEGCGDIDPKKIEDYFAIDGYKALISVMTSMEKDEALYELKKSKMRGRGGGSFTFDKWKKAKDAENDTYVVCNADEGDPGAFRDRAILECNPHKIIEAMIICGYVTESKSGVVFLRAEHTQAARRLELAIEQATEYGLLGENVLGTDFNFKIKLYRGASTYIHTNETIELDPGNVALDNKYGPAMTIENKYWKKPNVIHNVETFCNIPHIINKGGDWYATIGTEKGTGTKVFSLSGKINNTGIVEVPMGTTLKQVIFDIGGGVRHNKEFKAIQTGGTAGGNIYFKDLDMPIDYDVLDEVGSMCGAGTLAVLDEDDCMVSIAKYYLDFSVEESCGKCTACRIGNTRLSELLNSVILGKAKKSDLDKIKELGEYVKECSLCGIGQTAPNPVLSTIETFYDEYLEHVNEKQCRAGSCRELLSYEIDKEKCIGCTICAKNCPANCINGKIKGTHEIDKASCVKCGVCFNKCPREAVIRV